MALSREAKLASFQTVFSTLKARSPHTSDLHGCWISVQQSAVDLTGTGFHGPAAIKGTRPLPDAVTSVRTNASERLPLRQYQTNYLLQLSNKKRLVQCRSSVSSQVYIN